MANLNDKDFLSDEIGALLDKDRGDWQVEGRYFQPQFLSNVPPKHHVALCAPRFSDDNIHTVTEEESETGIFSDQQPGLVLWDEPEPASPDMEDNPEPSPDGDRICLPNHQPVFLLSQSQSIRKQLDQLFSEDPTLNHRCEKCRSCADCRNPDKILAASIQGDLENSYIRNCITIDVDVRKLVAKLPLVKGYEKLLKPNKEECDRRLRVGLRKLQKKSPEERRLVLDSIDKLVKRGFVVNIKDLTDEEKELLDRTDLGYYLPTSIVFKPDSLSTPCRVCLDASAATPRGASLNALMVKGDVRLSMPRLLHTFRADKVAVAGDLSSFYNRFKLDPSHWSLQKFRWSPTLDPDGVLETFIVKTVIYGVRAAGNLAAFGVEKLKVLHPELRSFLTAQYVDDIAKNFSSLREAKETVGHCKDILKSYELEFKSGDMVFSGEAPDDALLDDEGRYHVGPLKWEPVSDTYRVRVPILHMGKSDKGSMAHLSICDADKPEEILKFLPKKFSLATLLSKVAANYDGGSGHLTPLIAPLRQLTRSILLHTQEDGGETDWDFLLDEVQKKAFSSMTSEIKKLSKFDYPRYPHSEAHSSKTGRIIAFSDSGDFETCVIYLSLPMPDGSHSCQMMNTRSALKKVGVTVPRSELNAGARAAEITQELIDSLPEMTLEAHWVTDSETALWWAGNDSGVLQVYHQTRVGQIRSVFEKNLWHVPSEENPADDFSKGDITADSVGPSSRVFNGPAWIRTGLEQAATNNYIRPLTEVMKRSDSTKVDKVEYDKGIKLPSYQDPNLQRMLKNQRKREKDREHMEDDTRPCKNLALITVSRWQGDREEEEVCVRDEDDPYMNEIYQSDCEDESDCDGSYYDGDYDSRTYYETESDCDDSYCDDEYNSDACAEEEKGCQEECSGSNSDLSEHLSDVSLEMLFNTDGVRARTPEEGPVRDDLQEEAQEPDDREENEKLYGALLYMLACARGIPCPEKVVGIILDTPRKELEEICQDNQLIGDALRWALEVAVTNKPVTLSIRPVMMTSLDKGRRLLSRQETIQINRVVRQSNSVALVAGTGVVPPFKPSKVICGQLSGEAKRQLIEIQSFVAESVPGVRGRVRQDKLHLTLLAYNEELDLRNEAEDVIKSATKLSPKVHACQIRVYGGHAVVTITCEQALNISKGLLEVSRGRGINHDPVQGLHVTLFRNVGQEFSDIIEKELAELTPAGS